MMRGIAHITFILQVAILLLGCTVAATQPTPRLPAAVPTSTPVTPTATPLPPARTPKPTPDNLTEANFEVPGCMECTLDQLARIENTPGIYRVDIFMTSGLETMSVLYNPDEIDKKETIRAIERAGFEVVGEIELNE